MSAEGAEQYKAKLKGSGAIAQGGGKAVGAGATLVEGDQHYHAAPKPPRPPYTPPPLPGRDTLADHGPLPPGSYLTHERNPLFTGRSPYLLKLAETLLYGQGDIIVTQTAVASGLGGIGKTQLAVEFAHRYGQYFAGGVYWLNCENADNIPGELPCWVARPGWGCTSRPSN